MFFLGIFHIIGSFGIRILMRQHSEGMGGGAVLGLAESIPNPGLHFRNKGIFLLLQTKPP